MTKWFRVYDDLVDDPRCQLLSSAQFKKQFFGALKGEKNLFSRFVRRERYRMRPAGWAKLRQQIFARDDYTCQYCWERNGRLECDHIVPLCKGGSDDPANLTTACFACNHSKHGKTPEEWAAWRIRG